MTGGRSAGEVIPGLIVVAAVAAIAIWAASAAGPAILAAQGIDPAGKASPLSGVTLAVLLGLLIANVTTLPRVLAPGLSFAVKKLLRLGIVLVGLKLALGDVLELGAWGIPLVATIIAAALGATALLARAFGVSARLGTLTAAATSICGVTATVATAPVIGASDEEVAYTVANVTLFGMVAMLTYPYLAHAVFDSSVAAGMFLGTAIHDTSQVVAAALSYRDVFSDEVVFRTATITKLTRNVFIVGIVPLLGFLYRRKGGERSGEGGFFSHFPLFVAGFVAASLLRSAGDWMLASGRPALGVMDASTWSAAMKFLGDRTSYVLLACAMAGVGLTTRLSSLRRLGLRPLYLGASAAVVVGIVAAAVATVIAPLVTR